LTNASAILEEETGGRLLGFYTWRKTDLHIDVKATLPAGPKARRSAVSFFQDGEYQEAVNSVESKRNIQRYAI